MHCLRLRGASQELVDPPTGVSLLNEISNQEKADLAAHRPQRRKPETEGSSDIVIRLIALARHEPLERGLTQ